MRSLWAWIQTAFLLPPPLTEDGFAFIWSAVKQPVLSPTTTGEESFCALSWSGYCPCFCSHHCWRGVTLRSLWAQMPTTLDGRGLSKRLRGRCEDSPGHSKTPPATFWGRSRWFWGRSRRVGQAGLSIVTSTCEYTIERVCVYDEDGRDPAERSSYCCHRGCRCLTVPSDSKAMHVDHR